MYEYRNQTMSVETSALLSGPHSVSTMSPAKYFNLYIQSRCPFEPYEVFGVGFV